VTSPAAICQTVPDRCDDDSAVMTQPLAVALHALSRVAQRPEESVAVIGVGGIGSFIVAGAARRVIDGRVVAIDIDAERLVTATALGAHEVVDATGQELSSLLQELTDGVGFDVVIEASGAAHAPAAATVGVRRGGRVLLLGLHAAPRELDLTRMIVREVDVVTSVAHICDTDISAALDVLADSDVASVTAGPTIPLEALVEEGLRPLVEGRAAGKILIAPDAEPEVTPLERGTVAGAT
jgi:(R,R)-butanediol dehydrogenase/meso-butanediol dehydrogenase/diacetyl reductase